MRHLSLLAPLAAVAILMSCGDGGGIDPPAPDTRAVEGIEGWRLAVPSEPVSPGDEVRIWFNGSELEPGPRVDIRLDVLAPNGESVCCGYSNLGAPGWTWLPLTHTEAVGTYRVAIRDNEAGEALVETEISVQEE